MVDSFKAFDPDAEVIGRSMLSNLQNLNKEHFIPILQKHGISDIDPQGWYSQQKWLDILKDVAETGGDGLFDFVAVGLSVANLAPFPPEINSIDKAFQALGKVYQGNHRNGYVGELVCEQAEEGKVVVRMNSPYPEDFLYGVAYGIAKRYAPSGKSPKVFRDVRDNISYFTVTW